jgi:small conductance mechanosensitive channel
VLLAVEELPQTLDQWRHSTELLKAQGLQFAIHLLAAVAIFAIGWWLARMASRASQTMIARTKVDATVATFLSDFIYALLLLFVVVSALGQVGFDTTSFAAVIAAVGVAIGLALQGSLSNFASGILLILFKPFKVGDSVDVGTSGGTVEEIRIFMTLFRTADNVRVCIPNSQITQGVIKNYSTTGTRRIELLVNCSYDDDLKSVKQFLESLLAADSRILTEPKPTVVVNDLAEGGVQLALRPWVKTADQGDVRSDLVERIKLGFDVHKFSFPAARQEPRGHLKG